MLALALSGGYRIPQQESNLIADRVDDLAEQIRFYRPAHPAGSICEIR